MLISLINRLAPIVSKKCTQIATLSTTQVRNDLMQFFDNKKNWNESNVKHGREWREEELRLKSNTDLHKLWYVLLKERNMLLTMEEEYKRESLSFPSPERIAKVDESMENLLNVVKERDIAYNLLETGETKELVPYKRYNSFGYLQLYKPREHYVPWYMNTTWKLKYFNRQLPKWSKYYRVKLRANEQKERRRTLKFIEEQAEKLLNENRELNLDRKFLIESLKQKYKYKEEASYESQIRKPRPDEVPAKKEWDYGEF